VYYREDEGSWECVVVRPLVVVERPDDVRDGRSSLDVLVLRRMDLTIRRHSANISDIISRP